MDGAGGRSRRARDILLAVANRPRNGRLAPYERAAQVRSLRGEGLTHREIAERLDVSTSTIANDLHTTAPRRRAESDISSDPQPGRSDQAADGSSRRVLSALLTPARSRLGAARRLVP